jgi:hypothetical protein
LEDPSGVGTAEQAIESVSVAFDGCVESIGVGLAPIDHARTLVPGTVTLVGEGGPVTPVVVRTARCDGIAVDGSASKPGTVVQIGLVIVPPDGSGDINNYTLLYYTSHRKLATRLGKLGVDAQHVKQIAYALAEDPTPGSPLSVHVPAPGDPGLSLAGTVVATPAPAGSFQANWWVETCDGLVKMATVVPAIAIGGVDHAFVGPLAPELAALGFGNAPAPDFPILQQLNLFASAEMTAEDAD